MRHHLRPTSKCKLIGTILILLVVPLLVLVSYGAGDPPAHPPSRTPAPSAADIEKAEAVIRDLFKNDYAITTPPDRLALSKKLLLQAMNSTNDVASRYVLFREARDVAAAAGDLTEAWRAVDEMAKVFALNVPAMKLPPLQVVAGMTTAPNVNESLVGVSLSLAATAMRSEDYDTAEKLIKVADGAARNAKSVARAKAVAATTAALDLMRKENAKATEAAAVLANDPKDANANFTVGRYQCFYKEDWTAGLPRLALGSDAALKTLAENSLKESDDSAALAEIAAAWWDAAEKLPDAEKDAVRRFSAERYKAVLPKLTGLKKELAEKRIAEGRKVTERRYNLIALIDTSKDVVYGTWHIEKNQLHCDASNFSPRVQIPYRPPEEYDFVVQFMQPKLYHDVSLIMPNKHGGAFFWSLGNENGTAYCLSIGGSNAQTKLPAGSAILPNKAHLTVVQVRRDGVKCYLDGVLIKQYKTDFKDLLVDGWRELKDKSLLGLACDQPTVFQHVQIVEITGTGGRTR